MENDQARIIANGLEKAAILLVDKLDFTPSPSKTQWVRQAAVQLAVGMMRPLEGAALTDELLQTTIKDSVKMAEGIWLETRNL